MGVGENESKNNAYATVFIQPTHHQLFHPKVPAITPTFPSPSPSAHTHEF